MFLKDSLALFRSAEIHELLSRILVLGKGGNAYRYYLDVVLFFRYLYYLYIFNRLNRKNRTTSR